LQEIKKEIMELALIKEIKEIGLDAVAVKYKLSVKDYGHKVLIKYDQIESPMGEEVVQDARGIILEKGTWKIMCMSFRKFFNSAEGHAARIDWDSALILEKLDGSLMQVYFDWVLNEWCVATSGTADASGEVNNKFGTTFADLFWNTVRDKYNFDKNSLNKEYCFVFELTTPYNIVVTPHTTSSATLLTVRELKNLKEISRERLEITANVLNVPVVKIFDINASNAGHVIATLEGMPYTEEGYVVVDANFNRIKIKNPTYVAVHHLKSKTSEHAIMEIVKTNEVEEFAATFPERKEEIFKLKENYDVLRHELHSTWEELKGRLPRNITKEEQKKFAMAVFEVTAKRGMKEHSGAFFGLKDGKVETIDSYLHAMDNKKLYTIL
jgi:hypothetical protein